MSLRRPSEGSSAPLPESARGQDARRFLNRVELRVIEHLMPGDHGYRFFPAYYRHIFDIMRRTPLLDPREEETPQTAFDQLVVPPPVARSPSRTPGSSRWGVIERRRSRS